MTYNCDITKEGETMYAVRFPDMPNVMTFGFSRSHALDMAKEALEGVLEVDLDHALEIPESKYKGGELVEVSPKIAFAIELRKARAARSQREVAEASGMTYQQYQRLENPKKTNPTLETLYRLQKVFNRKFLAI